MDFKGKDIDIVLKALKKSGESVYASELQSKFLNDWQLLKVEAIFKYLFDNYKQRFDNYDYSEAYGYLLEYSNEWDDDLEKGGFEKYWSHKEKFKLSLKELLNNTKSGVSVVNGVLQLVDRFY